MNLIEPTNSKIIKKYDRETQQKHDESEAERKLRDYKREIRRAAQKYADALVLVSGSE